MNLFCEILMTVSITTNALCPLHKVFQSESNKQQRKEEYMNHMKKIGTILLLACLIVGVFTTSVGAANYVHEHNLEEYDCMNIFYMYRIDSCPWEGHYGGGVNHPYGCRVQVATYYTLMYCPVCKMTYGPYENYVHDCSISHTKTFLVTYVCPY